MPPDLSESTYVKAWLQNARSDLSLAKVPKTRSIQYSHLCFHAQQAAEKAIKAVLLARRIVMPRTHDLDFLLGQLPKGSHLTLLAQNRTGFKNLRVNLI